MQPSSPETVWTIQSKDPHSSYAGPDMSEQERDGFAEYAVTLGMLFWSVLVDGDDVERVFRLPETLHCDVDQTGVPRQLAKMMEHLASCYSDFECFTAEVGAEYTRMFAHRKCLQDEYSDLIEAVEVALLPMRTAEGHDARTMSCARSPQGAPPTVLQSSGLTL